MSVDQEIECVSTPGQEPPAAVPSNDDPICVTLSDRDADRVLEILLDPPAPNELARQAAKRYKQKYGR